MCIFLHGELHYCWLRRFWSLCAANIWRALSMFWFCRSTSAFCLLRADRSSSSVSLKRRSASSRLSFERPDSDNSPLRSLKSIIYSVNSSICIFNAKYTIFRFANLLNVILETNDFLLKFLHFSCLFKLNTKNEAVRQLQTRNLVWQISTNKREEKRQQILYIFDWTIYKFLKNNYSFWRDWSSLSNLSLSSLSSSFFWFMIVRTSSSTASIWRCNARLRLPSAISSSWYKVLKQTVLFVLEYMIWLQHLVDYILVTFNC